MPTMPELPEERAPIVQRATKAVLAPVSHERTRLLALLAVAGAMVTLSPEPWAALGAASIVVVAGGMRR